MGQVFNRGALGLAAGTIVWGSDTIKARISRTSETPSKDATAMTGLGVAGGDITVGSKTGPTEDLGTDRIIYDCGDITFVGVSGAQVDKLILFKFVTNDADSIPIAVVDFTAITPNGGDIIVAIAAGGAFYLQQ